MGGSDGGTPLVKALESKGIFSLRQGNLVSTVADIGEGNLDNVQSSALEWESEVADPLLVVHQSVSIGASVVVLHQALDLNDWEEDAKQIRV